MSEPLPDAVPGRADAPPWPADVAAAIAAAEPGAVDESGAVDGGGAVDAAGVALDGSRGWWRLEPGIGLAAGVERWQAGSATVYRFGPDALSAGDRFRSFIRALAPVASFEVAPIVADSGSWLVTGRPTGVPADRPDHHADPDDLVVALGAGLRALHEIPAEQFAEVLGGEVLGGERARGWPAVADRCRQAVEEGRVDQARLPHPYDRYSPDRLLALWLDGGPSAERRSAEGPVLCHGTPGAERFIIDGGRFSGFDRMEAPLIADRHLDLAIAHQSVQHHFGPEGVFRLYDAYGRDPDVVLLDHYILACHLLARGPAIEPAATADRS